MKYNVIVLFLGREGWLLPSVLEEGNGPALGIVNNLPRHFTSNLARSPILPFRPNARPHSFTRKGFSQNFKSMHALILEENVYVYKKTYAYAPRPLHLSCPEDAWICHSMTYTTLTSRS